MLETCFTMTFQVVITVGVAFSDSIEWLKLELDFATFWITFLFYSRSRPKREREGKNTIPLFIDF